MNHTVALRALPPALPGNVNLSSLLALLKKLQQLAEPLATAAGLREAIGLLVQLGGAAGLNAAFLTNLESLLTDSSAFNTVLSIIAYLESLGTTNPPTGRPHGCDRDSAPTDLTINAQSLADWLPVVIQILQLIESIRGNS